MGSYTNSALTEAIQWLSLSLQQKVRRTTILYHYTTLSTFGEFIKDEGQFFCTHYAALNDSSEIKCGIDTICEYFEHEIGIAPKSCNHLKECFELGRSKGIIKPTWIMSFSLAKDSLYQWGLYTDRQQGGYSIGFEFEELWRIVNNSNCSRGYPSLSLHLLPCLYTKKDKSEINAFLEKVFEEDEGAIRRFKDSGIDDPDAMASILAKMVLVSCLIKHDSFKYENEVRLVVNPVYDSYDPVSLVGGKPRWNTGLFPYCKMPLRSFIKEIWISPHGYRELLRASSEMMKCRHSLNYDMKLSKSPYNGR